MYKRQVLDLPLPVFPNMPMCELKIPFIGMLIGNSSNIDFPMFIKGALVFLLNLYISDIFSSEIKCKLSFIIGKNFIPE